MEEKKPNEYTKDEIFNMSDEEFDKNFKAVSEDKNAFNSFFQDESNNQNVKEESVNKNSDIGSNEGNVFDNNETNEDKQDVNENIDNNKNFWNNFNSVNQDDTSSNIEETKSSDNDTQSDDDNEVDEPSDNEPKNQPKIHKIKAYGQTMNFTTDELVKLAPKALHFTKKLQALAPFRRSISAMQENNITEDDLNQFIEMKKGNRTAIANFLGRNNIDTYDINSIDDNEARSYQPFKYGIEQDEFARITEELNMHPRVNELSNFIKTLDKESKDRIRKNPDVLEVLMSNIENGYFDIISSEANKRNFLDGGRRPMIDYYAECASEYYSYLDSLENNKKQNEFSKNIKEVRNKSKITGNTGIKTQKKQPKQINSAYDISDEELEAFEKQMGFI